MTQKKESISSSAWCRSLVLRYPQMGYKEALQFTKQYKGDKAQFVQHTFHHARYMVRRRLGIDSFDEIPVNDQGESDPDYLLRLYLKHHRPSVEAACQFFGPLFDITDSQVSRIAQELGVIDTTGGKRARYVRRTPSRRRKVSVPMASVSLRHLFHLARLVKQMGGIEQVKEALKVLEEVQESKG